MFAKCLQTALGVKEERASQPSLQVQFLIASIAVKYQVDVEEELLHLSELEESVDEEE